LLLVFSEPLFDGKVITVEAKEAELLISKWSTNSTF
jgi:hypothetical protein